MQNTPEQTQWLQNPESLSKRLREYTKNQIEFVLHEASWARINSDEQNKLAVNSSRFWVREISWQYHGKCWVWARTVIPESSLESLSRNLMQNPNLSIGDILFSGDKWQRGEIELFDVDQDHFYAAELKNFSLEMIWPLKARSSVFVCENKKILVTEVFFPEFLHV